MGDLLELAERCERASGPDRELDALIAPFQGLRIVEEGHPLGRCCYDENHRIALLPAYTASIDAAMTLLPDGTEFYVERFFDGKSQAAIWLDSTVEISSRECTTPALALTAAALRARHAEKADA